MGWHDELHGRTTPHARSVACWRYIIIRLAPAAVAAAAAAGDHGDDFVYDDDSMMTMMRDDDDDDDDVVYDDDSIMMMMMIMSFVLLSLHLPHLSSDYDNVVCVVVTSSSSPIF